MCDDKIKVKLRQICQNPTRDLAICMTLYYVLMLHMSCTKSTNHHFEIEIAYKYNYNYNHRTSIFSLKKQENDG